MISISAKFDVLVEYVLKFTTLTLSGSLSFLSLTRAQRIGCISAMFAPQAMTVSVSSMSSKQPDGSSIPNVCMKATAALAIQCLAFGSMLLLLNPPFISLTAV